MVETLLNFHYEEYKTELFSCSRVKVIFFRAWSRVILFVFVTTSKLRIGKVKVMINQILATKETEINLSFN